VQPGEAAGVVDHPVLGGRVGAQPLQHDGPVVRVDVEDARDHAGVLGQAQRGDLPVERRRIADDLLDDPVAVRPHVGPLTAVEKLHPTSIRHWWGGDHPQARVSA
jgi:hypothetical protein